jgi:hypothetical protein
VNLDVAVRQLLDAVSLEKERSQTHIGLNKVEMRGNEIEPALLAGQQFVRLQRRADEITQLGAFAWMMLERIEPGLERPFSKRRVPLLRRIEGEGQAELWIEVDQKDLSTLGSELGRHIRGQGRLSYSALVVDDRNDRCHDPPGRWCSHRQPSPPWTVLHRLDESTRPKVVMSNTIRERRADLSGAGAPLPGRTRRAACSAGFLSWPQVIDYRPRAASVVTWLSVPAADHP